MANSLGKYLSLLFLLSGTNIPALTSVNVDANIKNNISTDYLKRLPIGDYIIGPGDTLKVIVSREYPELTTTIKVDGEGTIYLPRLNRIYVKGLNISELQDLLEKEFKAFIKFPSVEVIIEDYRPIRVLVDGEVSNPGLQTLSGSYSVKSMRNNLFNDFNALDNSSTSNSSSFYFPTLFDAIRKSGGITPFSNLSEILVVRKNNLSKGGGRKSTILNLEEMLISGDSSQNIRIYDGDLIKIKKSNKQNNFNLKKAILSNLNPKFIKVSITGRVVNPGNITVSKASVLNDAIDLAGGVKAIKGPILFIRFNNDGTIDKRKFKYRRKNRRGSYENPLLKNGDLIFVDQNLVTITNEVLTEITKPFVGIFSTYGLIKAISD